MSAFLLRRALTLFILVFGVLFVVSLLKGRGVEGGLEYAALWAVLTTAVFAVIQAIRARRGAACEVCEDGSVEDEEAVLRG